VINGISSRKYEKAVIQRCRWHKRENVLKYPDKNHQSHFRRKIQGGKLKPAEGGGVNQEKSRGWIFLYPLPLKKSFESIDPAKVGFPTRTGSPILLMPASKRYE